ncbi:hypothetical protein BT96DRAFT_996462 [Gymnopus androsaceus JB14]|uniref:RING-type domain-containing protein n=1 Tax=Gymnopus androsaceus JB14 TaxID=1447944 RepID=A0A6A4HGE8_9AGAR|nr:hypothetical protein BT96DRAFT_996462 [Gymnopus androsaceus JB14]
MPPSNIPAKSTTAATNFTNSPLYSPAKMPTRTYGRKGKATHNRNSPQSSTALAYEELVVLPLWNVHSGLGSQAIDSDDNVIFVSESTRIDREQQLNSRTVLPLLNVCSGAGSQSSQSIDLDDDIIFVLKKSTNTSRVQQLEAELAEVTQRALDAHEQLHRTKNELKAFYKVQIDRFNCGICGLTLNNPHLLRCGHIYCAGCITEYLDYHLKKKTKMVICPTCRGGIGREPPAALHLLKEYIALMIEAGGLDNEEVFAGPSKPLDWTPMLKIRRAHHLFPVSP